VRGRGDELKIDTRNIYHLGLGFWRRSRSTVKKREGRRGRGKDRGKGKILVLHKYKRKGGNVRLGRSDGDDRREYSAQVDHKGI
jgi:hypothetical protein